MSLKFIYSMIF